MGKKAKKTVTVPFGAAKSSVNSFRKPATDTEEKISSNPLGGLITQQLFANPRSIKYLIENPNDPKGFVATRLFSDGTPVGDYGAKLLGFEGKDGKVVKLADLAKDEQDKVRSAFNQEAKRISAAREEELKKRRNVTLLTSPGGALLTAESLSKPSLTLGK